MEKELKEIENELKIRGIWEYEAKFACYDCGIFTYHVELPNDELHQFCFICDDTLLSELPVNQLLTLKRMSFFDHAVYIQGELLGRKMARINNNANLN